MSISSNVIGRVDKLVEKYNIFNSVLTKADDVAFISELNTLYDEFINNSRGISAKSKKSVQDKFHEVMSQRHIFVSNGGYVVYYGEEIVS